MSVYVKENAKSLDQNKTILLSLSCILILILVIFLEKLDFELRVKQFSSTFAKTDDLKTFQDQLQQDLAYRWPNLYQWLDSTQQSHLMGLAKILYLLQQEDRPLAFDQILKFDQYILPTSNDLQLSKALELKEQKQFKAAIQLIADRKDALGLGFKGMIEMDQGHLPEAMADFNQAITMHPYLQIFQMKRIECISWYLGPQSTEIALHTLQAQNLLSKAQIDRLKNLHLFTLLSDENQIFQSLDLILKSDQYSEKEKDLAIANMADLFLAEQKIEKIKPYLERGLNTLPNHPKLLAQQVKFEIISLRLKKANELISQMPEGLQSTILPLLWLSMGQIDQWQKWKSLSPSLILSKLSHLQTELLNVELYKNESQMIDLFDKKFLLSKNNLENVILLSALCKSYQPNTQLAKAKKACLDLRNLMPNHSIFSQKTMPF
jgi:tetratricopeptide (TPR) repeat protein